MPQSPETVLGNLKKGEYAPVYFLQGEENYYLAEISSYIESNVIAESEKAFNLNVIYGAEQTLPEIISYAKRYPVMSQHQVVIVKEAQNIKDLNKDKGEEFLINYVSNPVPSTILVFCYRGKTLDKRKSLYKSIDKNAVVVNSDKLYENQVPGWIKNYIMSRGHDVDLNAQQLLSDNIGNDLERLANEIDKMLINFKERTLITPGIVTKYIGISKEYNSFELQKAIAVRNILKANKIINYFSENPKLNPVIPLIALLFSYFSKLLVIHQAGQVRENELSRLIGVPPFFIKEYIQASKIYNLKKVIENIHYIREADLMSKGIGISNIADEEILKELVFKLMH
jgi:DNA polymerase-3 subunit delta